MKIFHLYFQCNLLMLILIYLFMLSNSILTFLLNFMFVSCLILDFHLFILIDLFFTVIYLSFIVIVSCFIVIISFFMLIIFWLMLIILFFMLIVLLFKLFIVFFINFSLMFMLISLFWMLITFLGFIITFIIKHQQQMFCFDVRFLIYNLLGLKFLIEIVMSFF